MKQALCVFDTTKPAIARAHGGMSDVGKVWIELSKPFSPPFPSFTEIIIHKLVLNRFPPPPRRPVSPFIPPPGLDGGETLPPPPPLV